MTSKILTVIPLALATALRFASPAFAQGDDVGHVLHDVIPHGHGHGHDGGHGGGGHDDGGHDDHHGDGGDHM